MKCLGPRVPPGSPVALRLLASSLSKCVRVPPDPISARCASLRVSQFGIQSAYASRRRVYSCLVLGIDMRQWTRSDSSGFGHRHFFYFRFWWNTRETAARRRPVLQHCGYDSGARRHPHLDHDPAQKGFDRIRADCHPIRYSFVRETQ